MGEETGRRSSSRDLDDSSSVAESRNRETRHLYEFGPYRLDPAERKLLHNNQIVELPPKAFDTLVLMVRNSGHLMEKDELIRTLWPDSFVEEGSLSNSIFLLRKALGEDPQYIETVPKRGYRFVGAVRCLPDEVRGHREVAQFRPLDLLLLRLPWRLCRSGGVARWGELPRWFCLPYWWRAGITGRPGLAEGQSTP